jgi:hypothetical protein
MDRAADDLALQPLIVLRVVIRSPDLETFVNKYSRFIKDDRIFIFTKSSQPAGTRVRFNLELADGQPLINGEGTVTRIRPDGGDPSKPPGMELRFVPLDEPSRQLVARMLAARDQVGRMPDQQTAPIMTGTDSQPIAIGGKFRDESTDVESPPPTPPPLPPRPPVIASHPVLEPLEKTGSHAALTDLDDGQDESGAVTLASGGPAGFRPSENSLRAPNEPMPTLRAPGEPIPTLRTPGENVPSGGFTSPDAMPTGIRKLPSQPPGAAGSKDERSSGNYATPTPLPMPIPAASGDEPSRIMQIPPTRLDKLPTRREDQTGGFAAIGPAPQFAEAFKAPLAPPPGNGVTPPNGTVPANPFSEISDGAIEYFVEWSVEQSTAPKAKAAASSFANVAMATPRAERRRTAVRPLMAGVAIGLLFGVPIGGAAVWSWRPAPAPVIVERMPEPPPPVVPEKSALERPAAVGKPVSVDKPAVAVAQKPAVEKVEAPSEPATKTETTKAATTKAEMAKAEPPKVEMAKVETAAKPEAKAETKIAAETVAKPEAKAEDADDKSETLQKAQPKAAPATVQIASHPSGAAITVDGEARGKTPLTLQLPTGTHEVSLTKDRYATATQTVDAPGKLDVTLKRPTATLHVDSDPPGGDVIVEGKPRGKAPVDVQLEAFHHYDVQVTLLGTKTFKKRVSLKPPLMSIDAKLEVVHK